MGWLSRWINSMTGNEPIRPPLPGVASEIKRKLDLLYEAGEYDCSKAAADYSRAIQAERPGVLEGVYIIRRPGIGNVHHAINGFYHRTRGEWLYYDIACPDVGCVTEAYVRRFWGTPVGKKFIPATVDELSPADRVEWGTLEYADRNRWSLLLDDGWDAAG